MIAKLTGRLDSSGAGHAVIDVGGVGYLVGASSRTLAALGPVGEAVTIHTEMLVAEDSIRLVGFARAEERDWYRLLTHVQGVGSRVALAILSALEPAGLHRAVATGDKAMVARANGVGPKLAQRIVNELKDKIGDLEISIGPFNSGIGLKADLTKDPNVNQATADAVSALVNLGYGRSEAYAAVAQAVQRLGDSAVVEMLIKDGLVELAAFRSGDPQ